MSTETPSPATCKMGWFEYVARAKAGVPDTMDCFNLEALMDGNKMSDTVRVGFFGRGEPYRSGPRKGQPRADKTNRRDVYVTRTELREAQGDFERRTGTCSDCLGSGETMKRWSASEGKTMKPCGRCAGSGKAA